MKNVLRLVLGSLLCIYTVVIVAAPYFTITKSNSVSFPANMLVGQAGVGDYIVTNVSGRSRVVNVQNLPAGFSVVTATDASSANCGDELVADNASCTLRLSYLSNSVITVSELLPSVCPSSNFDIGCVSPGDTTSFSIVATPTEDMASLSTASSTALSVSGRPTLSTSPDTILFVPGRTTVFNVTNTSSVTANNVQLVLPPEISSYLESSAVTSCPIVAPGHDCTFTLPISGDFPVDELPLDASVYASNAPALNIVVESSAGGLLVATDVLFTEPGTQAVTITNQGAIPATNLSISVGSGLSGVSANGGTCASTLASGATCTYNYQASQDAYGSATATVNYTQGTAPSKTATANIMVSNTSAVINPDNDNISQPISGNTSIPRTGTFTIKNTGNFTWQSPSVTRSSEDTWLSMSGCSSAVTPGSSCTISYTITPPFDLSSVITASGSNISDASQNFNPDEYISIGIEGDSAYQHLGYKAVKVTNLTSLSETLSNITAIPPSALASEITLCNSTGSNCTASYATDCQNNAILAPEATCHIWYQANAITSLKVTTTASVDVSVTATPSGGSANPLSRSVNFIYDNALYVGGIFTTAGGNSANRIAKWDGSSWATLGSGVDSTVSALISWYGDLYAGGSFTVAGGNAASRIAIWNGSNWSPMGSGASSSVTSFAILNDKLYVGGIFTSIDGVSASRVAAWDGNSWTPLGSGVSSSLQAMATLNGNLYITGSISTAGGVSVSNIAQWDGSSWSGLGSGVNSIAVSLGTLNSNLYVGGGFTTAGGSSASRIAQWNGTAWSPLGSGTASGVNTITSLNSIIYAGGSFTTAGGSSASRIAQWNGTAWSPLGSGTSSGLVSVLTSHGSNVYVGGTFTSAGGITVNNIAQWNTTNSSWSALALGTNGGVRALVVAPSLSLS